MLRKIITIDQEKCEGCGTCVTQCSKGAIKLIDGKARLYDSRICDAGGGCIPTCPMYAISIIEEDVSDFENDKASNEILRKMLAGTPPAFPPSVFSGMGRYCPCFNFKKNESAESETEKSTGQDLPTAEAP